MPELDFDRSLSLNRFYVPTRGKTDRVSAESQLSRATVYNISALMAGLHGHGHAFIDFKEANAPDARAKHGHGWWL